MLVQALDIRVGGKCLEDLVIFQYCGRRRANSLSHFLSVFLSDACGSLCRCRGKVSATSFTIIGVMNKCLTILLNLVVWDQHAPPGGIAALLLCLIGGALYRQAPMRRRKIGQVADSDDVWETELTTDEKDALLDSEEEGSGSFLEKRRPSHSS